MNVQNAIENHRSVRKYQQTPVSQSVVDQILNTAIRASSSGNMQAYSIIATRDSELRSRLYPLHFGQQMVLEAPLLLTFCSDFNRMRHWLRLRQAADNFDNFMSFMIGAIDAILVSQNVALCARYGTWYLLFGIDIG